MIGSLRDLGVHRQPAPFWRAPGPARALPLAYRGGAPGFLAARVAWSASVGACHLDATLTAHVGPRLQELVTIAMRDRNRKVVPA